MKDNPFGNIKMLTAAIALLGCLMPALPAQEEAAAQAEKLMEGGIVKSFYLVAWKEDSRVKASAKGTDDLHSSRIGTDEGGDAPLPAGRKDAGKTPAATQACEIVPEAAGGGTDIPPRETDGPPAAPAPATAVPDEEATPDERQLGMAEARTMSRLGRYQDALRIHRELRRKYPRDMFIWEDYVETLIDHRDYEASIRELGEMGLISPLSPRAARLRARIDVETRNYERSFPILERAVTENMGNAGVWADYGYSRQGGGDYAGALNQYAAALELDEENQGIRQAIRDILRSHRPRLEGGYRIYYQPGATATATYGGGFTAHGGNRLLVSLLYEQVQVDRPLGIYSPAIHKNMTGGGLEAGWRLGQGWKMILGGMGYSGFDGRLSALAALAALEYADPRLGKIRVAYRDNRPWYDPADAAYYNGAVSTGSVTYEGMYRERWGLALGYEHNAYRLADTGAYGRKDALSITVTRRVAMKPETYVGYSFYKSQFNYANDKYTPVSMIPSEALNSLFTGIRLVCNAYLDLNILGGGRYDTDRSLTSWYINPSFTVRLRNRLEFEGGYEYASDDRQTDGGATTSLTAKGRWIW